MENRLLPPPAAAALQTKAKINASRGWGSFDVGEVKSNFSFFGGTHIRSRAATTAF